MKNELPGAVFVKLGRLLKTDFNNAFKEEFGDEITPTQGAILGFVGFNPGVSLTKIASEFSLTKSSGSEAMSILTEKGYVEVRPDPNDKRGRRFYITEKGQHVRARAKETLVRNDARLFAEVSEEELEVVEGIYRKVMKAMGRNENE